MEVEVLATLLGIALAALVAACGAGFRWLRSDLKRLEDKFDRLETKVDNLIMALARSGVLIDPQAVAPGAAPPATGSPSTAQQSSRAPPAEPSGPTVQPA
ncbi:MAG: hypothetical protein OXC00_16530 [Acidimicrobiaceae bacterium]|nr:hypothetical protein [Acidimicrobiaceae bacterium]